MTLHLSAQWDGERIRAVSVACVRPLAARALVGRKVGDVCKLVPALFALCGVAQGAAARAACRAAAAAGVGADDPAATERALAAEMAREHLWRLMLDWPALFDLPVRRDEFARLHRRLMVADRPDMAAELGAELLDLLGSETLGGVLLDRREPGSLADLLAAARRGGAVGTILAALVEAGPRPDPAGTVPQLAVLGAGEWARELGDVPSPAFCRIPERAGSACETGALARHAEASPVRLLLENRLPVAARLFARLLDLAECARRLRQPLVGDRPPLLDAAALGAEGGIACVQTARGVLLHGVRLEGDTVADYAIVAPTEWNFHPSGAFFREGAGWEADGREEAVRRLKALVLALDPCVDFELVVEDMDDA